MNALKARRGAEDTVRRAVLLLLQAEAQGTITSGVAKPLRGLFQELTEYLPFLQFHVSNVSVVGVPTIGAATCPLSKTEDKVLLLLRKQGGWMKPAAVAEHLRFSLEETNQALRQLRSQQLASAGAARDKGIAYRAKT